MPVVTDDNETWEQWEWDKLVHERDKARAACDDFHYRYTEKLCQVAKLLNERDEGREGAARLWAATQALLKQREQISVWGDTLQDKYKTLRQHRDQLIVERDNAVKVVNHAIEETHAVYVKLDKARRERNEARAEVERLRQQQSQVAANARRAALEEALRVCEETSVVNLSNTAIVVTGGLRDGKAFWMGAEAHARVLARRIRALLDAAAPTPGADNG